MNFREWARLQQEHFLQHPPKPQDQLNFEFYGGPMDGAKETMHPAMNSTIERSGYRYVCEFGARKLRCVGQV